MSDLALNNSDIPDQHAPDPVISHGDPIPPGKLAIWLFLASEIMFFIGLLGTYIVFRSGSPKLFEAQGAMLDKLLAGINTLVLIFSSLTMALAVDAAQKNNRPRLLLCLSLTILMGFGFMGIKTIEYSDKFRHFTVFAKEGKGKDAKFYIYDGHRTARNVTVNGHFSVPAGTRLVALTDTVGKYDKDTPAAVIGKAFDGRPTIRIDEPGQTEITVNESDIADIDPARVKDKAWTLEASRRLVPPTEEINVHTYTPKSDPMLTSAGHEASHDHQHFTLDTANINDAVWYGPQKSIFYSCYFALTGIHGLHVVGGIIPMAILLLHALRGRIFPAHTEYLGLYWHFVDVVWIFLFPLLYLI